MWMLLFNVRYIGNKECMAIIYCLNICILGFDVERKQEALGGRKKRKNSIKVADHFCPLKKKSIIYVQPPLTKWRV